MACGATGTFWRALAAVAGAGLWVVPLPAEAAEPAICLGMQPTIVGTPGDDSITGTNGPHVIDAGQGDDTILGVVARSLVEGSGVSRENGPRRGSGRRCDEQVVCAARSARPARVGQQLRMGSGDVEVVVLGGDGGEHLDEGRAHRAPSLVGEVDADEKLDRGDRRDRDVVLVGDHAVEVLA